MSFWPGEKLRYAETHFKFRLPWSLLYRPWPEIIFDMPFQAVPGTEPTMWIVVRDADRFPVTLESAEIEIESSESTGTNSEKRTITLDIEADKPFAFYPVPLAGLKPGKYRITPKVTTVKKNVDEGAKNERRTFTRWSLPGLKPQPLKLHVLAEQPPKAPGYAAGEMHCHTHY